MFAGDVAMDTQKLADLRERLNQLKADYVKIVGGKDIPIYFGKLQWILGKVLQKLHNYPI